MLKFQIEPRSFIRAAVLHLRLGVPICPDEGGTDLLGGWGDTADDPSILRKFEECRARERWGEYLDDPQIRKLLFFNLRHGNTQWQLLTDGIQELLHRGPQHLLHGTGPAAKKLLNRRNQVVKEIHRLTGFTRLVPAPDGTMVGKAPTQHNTGDLVALGLARRNPGQPLALLTPTGCWFARDGRVAPMESKYRDMPDDGFSQVWLTYYRSQFIQERNNPRHAARAIPQEYWQWLEEGTVMMEARDQKSEVRCELPTTLKG
jgi:probable DNA metabolism protein